MFEHLQVTISISPSKHVTCAVINHPLHIPVPKFLSEFNNYCSSVIHTKTKAEFLCERF